MKITGTLITVVAVYCFTAGVSFSEETALVKETTSTVKYAVEDSTTTAQGAVAESTPTIKYVFVIDIDFDAEITIEVYDSDNNPVMSTGSFKIMTGTVAVRIDWDGKDNNKALLRDATYYYDMYAFLPVEKAVRMVSGKFEIVTDTMVAEPPEINQSFKKDFIVIDKSAFKINKIEIKGNTRTNTKDILNKFNIKQRSFYTAGQIEDRMKSMEGSPFAEVAEHSIVSDKTIMDAVLRVKISEKTLNSVRLRGGYSSNALGGEGQLIGALDFSSKNLYDGVHREIDVFTEGPYTGRAVYDINYLESIGDMFYSINFHNESELFSQGAYDAMGIDTDPGACSYEKRSIGISFVELFEGKGKGVLGYRWENIELYSSPGRSKNNFLLGLIFDKKEDCWLVMSRLFNEIFMEVGLDSADDRRHVTKLETSVSHEFSMGEGIVLEFMEGDGIMFTRRPDLCYYDLFRLGGMKNLRGFTEDAFTCLFYIWGSLELTVPLWRDLYFCLFGSAGVWSDSYVNLLEDGGVGYGAGFKLDNDRWSFDISLATNNQQSPNDFRLYLGSELEF